MRRFSQLSPSQLLSSSSCSPPRAAAAASSSAAAIGAGFLVNNNNVATTTTTTTSYRHAASSSQPYVLFQTMQGTQKPLNQQKAKSCARHLEKYMSSQDINQTTGVPSFLENLLTKNNWQISSSNAKTSNSRPALVSSSNVSASQRKMNKKQIQSKMRSASTAAKGKKKKTSK